MIKSRWIAAVMGAAMLLTLRADGNAQQVVPGNGETEPPDDYCASRTTKDKTITGQCNLTIQWMHRIDKLRSDYNLDGSGIVVSVIDTAVWADHPEWGVGQITGGAVEGDSHGTAVVGTIAARGILPIVEGIAPAVTVRSHSMTEPKEELRKRLLSDVTGGSSGSNHSYGSIVGWVDGLTVRRKFEVQGDDACKSAGNKKSKVYSQYYYDALTGQAAFGTYSSTASKTLDGWATEMPAMSFVAGVGNDRNDGRVRPEQEHQVCHCRLGELNPKTKKTTLNCTAQPAALAPPPDGGMTGFDSLPQASKNAIVVGAILKQTIDANAIGQVETTNFSSWGPTDDGRIKPDVVAFGYRTLEAGYSKDKDDKTGKITIREYAAFLGTSLAAPVVTGVGVLLNQLSKRVRRRELCADEMKTALIHTARGPGKPNFQIGWGSVDALGAGKLVAGDRGQLFTVDMEAGKPIALRFQWRPDVDRSIGDARITATWLDEPGSPDDESDPRATSSNSKLVHDIDLELTPPSGKTKIFAWSVEPVWNGGEISGSNAHNRAGPNSRDNVERIDVPAANWEFGTWNLSLKMKSASGAKKKRIRVSIASSGLMPLQPTIWANRCE